MAKTLLTSSLIVVIVVTTLIFILKGDDVGRVEPSLLLKKWFEIERSNCGENELVVRSSPNFPSYCDFETGRKIEVSWDKRSLLLNGERALFLSGSIHGPRFAPGDWPQVLDLAVKQGLNCVQVYVFWNAHQKEKDAPLDWEENLNLAKLIRLAGGRGLFVNLRLGPYVCAEWSYGGLPVFLGLEPGMLFRTYNQPWMQAMANFSYQVAHYIRKHKLFASQGGPVVMAQIENELSIADDPQNGEAYVAWCGELAQSLETNLAWIMCNGETADGLINSCNGQDCVDFLFSNGQNGRVLKTQPALWTELEAGYQIWGESSRHPSDYFWGDTARDQARQALRWFARGGSHLNLYMWAGGSNFASSAAAGITQGYAFDASICANALQEHQPKFDHFSALFKTLAQSASDLLSLPLPSFNGTTVDYWNGFEWVPATQQRIFYFSSALAMIESDYDLSDITVRFSIADQVSTCVLSLAPLSVAIINPSSCSFLYDSGRIAQSAMEYRRLDRVVAHLSDPEQWSRYKLQLNLSKIPETLHPIEQSRLCLKNASEQYALYETRISTLSSNRTYELKFESEHSMAFLIFIDKQFVAAQDEHSHAEGFLNFTFTLGPFAKGTHLLSIVSENLGYHNLIGRWGASRTMKQKGLLGSVLLNGDPLTQWRSVCGLEPDFTEPVSAHSTLPGIFSRTFIDLARFNENVLLDAKGLGRGHLYLNGHDLGRFWNITRDSETRPTQRYYSLPRGWFSSSSGAADLYIFDALGGDPTQINLIHTSLRTSPTPMLPDEVDSPASCLE